MAPIFPHISEELWHRRGHDASIHLQSWPMSDAEKTREEAIAVAVQVNGRVRDRLMTPPGAAAELLEKQALALDSVQRWLDGKQIQRVIVVPDRLVNVVVK
jgi:leucyl-tRNA synthetase